MAQQYPDYMYPGIDQAMMPSSYCVDYNYAANYQPRTFYNQQYMQQYPQYQYDPHVYYPIMSNNGGGSNTKQSEQESPKSDEASSSALFYCFWQPCVSQNKAFKRKADLERHIAAIHTRDKAEMIDCEHPGCHRRGEYGFLRRDKMIEHMRDVHKTNIPKRGKKSP